VQKQKDRHTDLLGAIQRLKEHNLHDVGVVRAYHARRVAPIMAWTLSLYQMGPDVTFHGSVMSTEVICDTEIG